MRVDWPKPPGRLFCTARRCSRSDLLPMSMMVMFELECCRRRGQAVGARWWRRWQATARAFGGGDVRLLAGACLPRIIKPGGEVVEGLTPARATNDGRVSMRASVERKAQGARRKVQGARGHVRGGGVGREVCIEG